MKDEALTILAGGWKEGTPCGGRAVFSELVLSFLEDLRKEILTAPETKNWPEAVSFAFWCRRGRLLKWKEEITEWQQRKGRGILFHVAPSNIPALFAYSMVYGMLSGNGNLIRISEKIRETAQPLLNVIERILKQDAYRNLYQETLIFTYAHDTEWNAYFSGICNGRILWGGDATILAFRSAAVQPGCIQMEFPDRYSVALLEEDYIDHLNEKDLQELAERFYNDTYEADQNACSSPKVIFWIRGEQNNEARNKWWEMVYQVCRGRYLLDTMRANEKYAQLCRTAMDVEEIEQIIQKDNYLYRIVLHSCNRDLTKYQGNYGTFYEYGLEKKEDLCEYLTRKIQTIIYAGNTELKEIRQMIRNGNTLGGDRVVSPGEALLLAENWDGNDMIRTLSRVIG